MADISKLIEACEGVHRSARHGKRVRAGLARATAVRKAVLARVAGEQLAAEEARAVGLNVQKVTDAIQKFHNIQRQSRELTAAESFAWSQLPLPFRGGLLSKCWPCAACGQSMEFAVHERADLAHQPNQVEFACRCGWSLHVQLDPNMAKHGTVQLDDVYDRACKRFRENLSPERASTLLAELKNDPFFVEASERNQFVKDRLLNLELVARGMALFVDHHRTSQGEVFSKLSNYAASGRPFRAILKAGRWVGKRAMHEAARRLVLEHATPPLRR